MLVGGQLTHDNHMTIKELINVLRTYPPDMVVCVHAENYYTDDELKSVTECEVTPTRIPSYDANTRMMDEKGTSNILLLK
jgi:hypothetical protein